MVTEWISVMDRLPESKSNVLLYGLLQDGSGPTVTIGFLVCKGTPEETWIEMFQSYTVHPTHWMPLPEPPE